MLFVIAILAACIVFMVSQKTLPQVESIDQRIAAAPADVGLRIEAARGLEAKGKIGEAREQMLAALNFDPANPYATAVYRQIGAKSESLERDVLKMQEILAVRPDYQKAWAKLATLYEYQGRDDLASEARQKADELARVL